MFKKTFILVRIISFGTAIFILMCIFITFFCKNDKNLGSDKVFKKILERKRSPERIFNSDYFDDKYYIPEKIKGKHHIPRIMLEFFDEFRKGSKRGCDVVKSIIPKEVESVSPALLGSSQSACDSSQNSCHVLLFHIPEREKEEVLISAELRVLILTDETSKTHEHCITVGYLNKININVLQKNTFQREQNGWEKFSLTNALIKHKWHGKDIKIFICIGADNRNKMNNTIHKTFNISVSPKDGNNTDHDYPILMLSYTIFNNNISKVNLNQRKNKTLIYEVYSKNSKVVRNKREVITSDDFPLANEIFEVNSHRKKSYGNSCRRKPLFIDFSEIEYDSWIVQPRGYEAYQCVGKCFYPVTSHLTPTKHAVLQTLVHSVAPGRVARACCVPTRLSSISILYLDRRGVLTYRYGYRDMSVLECGCR